MIFFFFFNDTATTEIYTLSLHDALPISTRVTRPSTARITSRIIIMVATIESNRIESKTFWREAARATRASRARRTVRSEEHTSELQSRQYLVCRLLLEKKNNTTV